MSKADNLLSILWMLRPRGPDGGSFPDGTDFARPEGFSAREFFMRGILPDPDDARTVMVRIRGREETVADLCGHWYFAHVLVERSASEARFRMDELAIRTYAPYFLLPYGKSIHVVEPAILKRRLAEIAAELAEHYRA